MCILLIPLFAFIWVPYVLFATIIEIVVGIYNDLRKK